ncbi:MAG: hypothetical protein WC564_02595 [Patescibacteria group bacterium]
MKKIIEWIRILKACGLRHKLIIIAVLSSLLLIFSIFYGVVYGKLWLWFPARIKAEIALNRLGVSSYNNPICHETCFYERQLYKKVIAANLDQKRISERVKRLILAEDNNLVFRLELVDSWSHQNNLPFPDYFSNYLVDGLESSVQEKIRELFGVDDLSVEELVNNFSVTSSSSEQLDILRSLQEKSDSSLSSFYLDLIISHPDVDVKNGALSALSNLSPSVDYITPDFLLKIKKMILDQNLNKYLRKELILLLGDYLSVQEDLVLKILSEAYEDKVAVDNFSRLFIADTLNRFSVNNYVKPEISVSEWQDYRDHNSLWGND